MIFKYKSLLFGTVLIGAILMITGCSSESQSVVSSNESASGINDKQEPKKILLVHSYHKDFEWTEYITRGVRQVLGGPNAEINVFYMDTKRKTSEQWKLDQGRIAYSLVEQWKPDAVIASDDNAQKYFVSKFAKQSDAQFVFCGVNAEAEEYGFPMANVTGVLERPHFKESVDLLRLIDPSVKNIAVLSDYSPTTEKVFNYMKTQKVDVAIDQWMAIKTFDEWKQTVLDLQDKVDAIAIYTYHTIKKEGEEQSVDPLEIINWTAENSKVPLIGFLAFSIDHGMTLGFVESGLEQGSLAAQMASLIAYNNQTAGNIPIKIGKKGQSMLNFKAALRTGLKVPLDVYNSIDIIVEKN